MGAKSKDWLHNTPMNTPRLINILSDFVSHETNEACHNRIIYYELKSGSRDNGLKILDEIL